MSGLPVYPFMKKIQEQTILDFSPTQWLKSNPANFDFRPASSEFVERWLDISGNNNHTDVQTIEAAQPSWNGSRLNFKLQTYLKALSSINLSEHTYLLKAYVNSINNSRSPILANLPAPTIYYAAHFTTGVNKITTNHLSTNIEMDEEYLTNEWTFGVKASVATPTEGYAKTANDEFAHDYTSGVTRDFYIGSSNNFRFSDSFIDEFVYFDRALSLADFQRVFNLMGN